jgi:endonuclease-3
MPRESQAARRTRTDALREVLARTYPDAHCELNYQTPLQLLIATILSAQCTDRQVNIVTADLFRKYSSAADYAQAEPQELEADLRRLGLYRNKTRHIQRACQSLVERHGGEVPRSLPELTALDGVGRKTANVVLGNAFDIEAGIVVDTHVARLSQRLGLSRHQDPVAIEQDLLALVPVGQWTLFSHWLIWHGRRRCTARNPDCSQCELARLCPSYRPNSSTPSTSPGSPP